MIAPLTLSGVQVGWAWMTSAAVPAVCGDAIEVPDSVWPSVPLPERVDTIETPGAGTSGLSHESPVLRPPALNGARSVPALAFTPVMSPELRPMIAPGYVAKPASIAAAAIAPLAVPGEPAM